MAFWKMFKLKYIQNRKKYRFILIIFVIIFIILNFFKFHKSIYDDIIIFNLWDKKGVVNEFEINSQNIVEIDVFTTINNNSRKIAPGSKGDFLIKFKRPYNSKYRIKINEKTLKPQNLYFTIENVRYSTLKEIEEIINEKFINTEILNINWEWKYYINDIQDVQDTKDAQNITKYIFEIEVIVEEPERMNYESKKNNYSNNNYYFSFKYKYKKLG